MRRSVSFVCETMRPLLVRRNIKLFSCHCRQRTPNSLQDEYASTLEMFCTVTFMTSLAPMNSCTEPSDQRTSRALLSI